MGGSVKTRDRLHLQGKFTKSKIQAEIRDFNISIINFRFSNKEQNKVMDSTYIFRHLRILFTYVL